ncbi:MAG: cupin domain-containing protein [Clostridiales bacterium]|jgi:quercetin dioxygenase-like cupin family protein|nr:cupin domain-containing protein [Clostridiales bacterium]
MLIINSNDIEWGKMPGRDMKWLISKGKTPAKNATAAMISLAPGQTSAPAHSHPFSEEVIYILSGSGKAYINGSIYDMTAGCVVIFPKGEPHMLRNSGNSPLEAVCFFAPATELSDYVFHEDILFE